MSAFVLDASVAMSWCIDDEASPETDALLVRARDEGAAVPELWFWEVGNVLTSAIRRGRLTSAGAALRLQLLSSLPVSGDADGAARAWRETLQLAQTHRLTVYDAAYLELALRLGVDLASLDLELRRAAGDCGVRVLP